MGFQLAILRHGHTDWNLEGRIQGRVNRPLDANALKDLSSLCLPLPYRTWDIVTSPLLRAYETAVTVSVPIPQTQSIPDKVDTPIITDARLTEMDWGRFEGQRGQDLVDDPLSGYRHLEEWGWDFTPPDGESPRDVWARVEPWLNTLTHSSVIVSHMGIMRVLLARAYGWNFLGEPPFKVKRNRLYILNVTDDGHISPVDDPVRLERREA